MLSTDGPGLLPASTEYHCLEKCPVSLVCGYNLDSNPPAIITWTDPQGNLVDSNGIYTKENGPKVVQLNISSASKEDGGTWKCNVTVNYANASINTMVSEIHLTVFGKFSFPTLAITTNETHHALQLLLVSL